MVEKNKIQWIGLKFEGIEERFPVKEDRTGKFIEVYGIRLAIGRTGRPILGANPSAKLRDLKLARAKVITPGRNVIAIRDLDRRKRDLGGVPIMRGEKFTGIVGPDRRRTGLGSLPVRAPEALKRKRRLG